MSQSATVNRRIVLASRPQGAVGADNFRLERLPLPSPGAGQVLLRSLWLSVDPYMRGRMDKTRSYTKPIEVGGVMFGGNVCRVMESQHPDYRAGQLVLAFIGWQDYAVMDGGIDLMPLDPAMARPSLALGALGLSGFTAWVGLKEIGEPKAGETLVVGAATGAVGAVVGQLAKLAGCHTVGIAGSTEKCDYAVAELGYDACVNHRDGDLLWQLREVCPRGIDIYFENLGGAALNAVMPQLNVGARVPVCGLMSYYNNNGAIGADSAALIMSSLLIKRVKMQGFIFDDHRDQYGPKYQQFFLEMSALIAAGQVKCREDVMEGLESAPEGLARLLRGDNFGKLVVRVSAD